MHEPSENGNYLIRNKYPIFVLCPKSRKYVCSKDCGRCNYYKGTSRSPTEWFIVCAFDPEIHTEHYADPVKDYEELCRICDVPHKRGN